MGGFDTRLKQFWGWHLLDGPRARYCLAILSFAESIFFPIAPDVLLAPMALRQPEYRFRYAMIVTIASVCGGMVAYALGYFFSSYWSPYLLKHPDLNALYHVAQENFKTYGFWYVLAAGITPIPYKIVTLSAGIMRINFLMFTMASVLGRGARFFFIGYLVACCPESQRLWLQKQLKSLGWVLVVCAAIYCFIKAVTSLS